MRLTDETLDAIERLYDDGLFVQAHALGARVAPIREWEGGRGRLLGGRLASHLGHQRLGNALFRLAFRATPSSLAARSYRVRTLLHEAGPWDAWQLLRAVRT